MSLPRFGLFPTFQEKRDFRFSTDQRCESSWLRNIKATGGTTFTEHLIYVYGLSDTTQGLCSQVLALKIPLHQAICCFTDGNRIRCSQPLDARTRVWNLPERQQLLPPLTPHLPHND